MATAVLPPRTQVRSSDGPDVRRVAGRYAIPVIEDANRWPTRESARGTMERVDVEARAEVRL